MKAGAGKEPSHAVSKMEDDLPFSVTGICVFDRILNRLLSKCDNDRVAVIAVP